MHGAPAITALIALALAADQCAACTGGSKFSSSGSGSGSGSGGHSHSHTHSTGDGEKTSSAAKPPATGDGDAGGPADGQALLKQALGGDVSAQSLTSTADGTPVSSANELQCDAGAGCGRWANADGDGNDFARIDGTPDGDKWSELTGSDDVPSEPFLLCASEALPADQGCELESDPITCAIDGTLSLRHWRSRAHDEADRPRLRVCVREAPGAAPDACQTVGPDSGPSIFTLPSPMLGPFTLVIKADQFVNEPEGGFVAVDDIQFSGSVDEDPNSCQDDGDFDGDSNGDNDLESAGDSDEKTGTEERESTTTLQPADNEGSCLKLKCAFEGDTCEYTNPGKGSLFQGNDGWKVVDAASNPTNPLTGVKEDFTGSTSASQFAVAEFPDPADGGIEYGMRYALESPPVHFDRDDLYLSFQRYAATAGGRLRVCEDEKAIKCFYDSPELSRFEGAPDNRQWIKEVVPLPRGEYQIFVLAQYDLNRVFNAGQLGIDEIEIHSDPSGGSPFC